MRIGLMGGTFDPIHMGHLVAAESARTGAGLDEVWLLPSNSPPHKDRATRFTAEQRFAMAELAVRGTEGFRVCGIELELGGVSYTVGTVEALKLRYPEHSFSFIIGADMVEYLPKWHRIDEIASMVDFIGLGRPGFDLDRIELPAELSVKVRIVEMPRLELSSTEIRRRLDSGESIRFLVPEAVSAYIEQLAKRGGEAP